LRALDRSGKPCRKWQKGSFKVKSFTGVVWELPRWKAPPKSRPENSTEGSSTGDSSKENKENSQRESEKSEKSEKSGVDIEMISNGNLVSSPAPPSGLQHSSTPDDISLPTSSAPAAATTSVAEATTPNPPTEAPSPINDEIVIEAELPLPVAASA
jgi:hypothetical protein